VNFSDARRSPGWIVLIATLGGIIWGASTFVGHAASSTIYINNCGSIDYQPDVIFQACADGNIGVGEIVWDRWTKDGATGVGTFTVNDCEPDCASGKYLTSRVEITLTGSKPLQKFKGKEILDHIKIEQVDKKKLPLNNLSTLEWDLAEFSQE
jgi:hypothetical protein